MTEKNSKLRVPFNHHTIELNTIDLLLSYANLFNPNTLQALFKFFSGT